GVAIRLHPLIGRGGIGGRGGFRTEVSSQSVDVCALARSWRSRLARAVQVGERHTASAHIGKFPELMKAAHGPTPVRHRASRVSSRGGVEFLGCLLVPEGVQERHSLLELHLRSGVAGSRESDSANRAGSAGFLMMGVVYLSESV